MPHLVAALGLRCAGLLAAIALAACPLSVCAAPAAATPETTESASGATDSDTPAGRPTGSSTTGSETPNADGPTPGGAAVDSAAPEDDVSAAEVSTAAITSCSINCHGTVTDVATAGAALGLFLPLLGLPLKGIALTIVPPEQFISFDNVITRESGWNPYAINPRSGAYGLGQALPPEKMATHGPDWRTNPVTQLHWTYDYMNARYGSPNGAWAFWQTHGWY
jgi:hypothetical protein